MKYKGVIRPKDCTFTVNGKEVPEKQYWKTMDEQDAKRKKCRQAANKKLDIKLKKEKTHDRI